MRITLLTLWFMSLAAFGFSQTAEVNAKGEILSDKTPIATIEKDGCGTFSLNCDFFIRNEKGELLITVNALEYRDPMEVDAINDDGLVRYFRFTFVGMNVSAEVPNSALLVIKPIHVAKSVVKWHLIEDGQLNEQAVNQFVQAYGTKYSERREKLTPIIIR